MVLENTFLIAAESSKCREIAEKLLGIEEIRSTKVLGVHDLPENVLATIYSRPSEGLVDVYLQIDRMEGVLGIRPLGKTNVYYEKRKNGDVVKL